LRRTQWSVRFHVPTSRRILSYLSRFALIGALAAFSGCKPGATSAAARATPAEVEVAKPLQRDEPVFAEWVGTLDGLVNAQVRAPVSGYLLERHYPPEAKPG
jgi:membrane fusion protein (multidrug efflux system)